LIPIHCHITVVGNEITNLSVKKNSSPVCGGFQLSEDDEPTAGTVKKPMNLLACDESESDVSLNEHVHALNAKLVSKKKRPQKKNKSVL